MPGRKVLLAAIAVATGLMLGGCPSPQNPDKADIDGDGVIDSIDNCPTIANANQSDADGNGVGDVCEPPPPPDRDHDGVPDATDNCPTVANADQADTNHNGIGDACDIDTDGDGILDMNDNCPTIFNQDQKDSDNDGVGDVCDGNGLPPTVSVISNRSDLISGNDVLVAVAPPAAVSVAALTITLNGTNVSSQFATAVDGQYEALLSGLTLGSNTVVATVDGVSASMNIDNHPQGGPVLSGPQLQPWTCRNSEIAKDAACNQDPEYTWYYMSTSGGSLQPYDTANPPTDVANTTTENNETVPFIVRVETGYQDRDQYQIAVLMEPGKDWSALSPQATFNHKLLITHGASCGVDYRSGTAPSVIRYNPTDAVSTSIPQVAADSAAYALGQGYALMSTALDNSGHNCSLPLQAESLIMAKEHLVEHYGTLRYTIGTGCSGGSLAQQWIANAYPGIYQGILPTCSFPDAWSTATQFADYHLLLTYFFGDLPSPFPASGYAFVPQHPEWTETQMADVLGHASIVNAEVSEQAQWHVANPQDPCSGIGDPDPAHPDTTRYDPETNPAGIRCSIVQAAINVFGPRPSSEWGLQEQGLGYGFAGFPIDNVGVQYGLSALQQGQITPQQFIDLNTAVGGLDIDTNSIPDRTPASQPALPNAYRSGMINEANNLDRTAIIDCRGPDPGAFHDAYRAFAIRARLDREHGNHDNQLIWEGPAVIIGDTQCNLNSLKAMNDWLDKVEGDTSTKTLVQKLTAAKNDLALDDQCYDGNGQKLSDGLCPDAVVPVYGTPRMVAGDAISTDTNKCQLKPYDSNDYVPRINGTPVPGAPPLVQQSAIDAIFPDGVCDFTKPGVDQQGAIPWMTYQDASGNVVYGGQPLPATPANTGTGWMSPSFGGY